MQIAFPVLVGILAALGDKAVFLVGLGMVVGLGTVVVYKNGFAWMPWQVRTHIAWFKEWALEDSDAMIQSLHDLMDAFMYLGSVALVFMFYGFLVLVFMNAVNITDVTTLPIFGSVIDEITKTLGTGATVIVVGFLMIIFVPIIVLVTKLGRKTTESRS